MSDNNNSNIYQEIWDIDQANNGVPAILASEDGVDKETVGYVKVDETRSESTDKKDHLLFTEVAIPKEKRETYELCQALFDNYTMSSSQEDQPFVDPNDPFSLQNTKEFVDFLNATLTSKPMERAREYLIAEGKIPGDPTSWIIRVYELWFTSFSFTGQPTRSGFEHVFVGEQKLDKAILGGYHFWYKYWVDDGGDIEGGRNVEDDRILYDRQNYKGGLSNSEGVRVPEVATIKYTWEPDTASESLKKEVGGFFVGCSPEGLMALGTVRFFDENEGKNVTINGNNYDLALFKEGPNKRQINTFYPKLKSVKPIKSDEGEGGSEKNENNAGMVKIEKALVNPSGSEPGNETVTVKNFASFPISINGWKIAGNNGDASERFFLIETSAALAPGESRKFTLSRQGNRLASLRNSGGDIKLYDADNKTVDVVTYTRSQASEEATEITFSN